jgi:hypothetical protein
VIDPRTGWLVICALTVVWLIVLRLLFTVTLQDVELDALRAALASRRGEARSWADERASRVKAAGDTDKARD